MPFANIRAVKGDTAPPVAEARNPSGGGIAVRIVSAVVAVPPALAAIHYGAPAFSALVAVGSAILIWEWLRLCGAEAASPRGIAAIAVVLAAVGAVTLQGIPAAAAVAVVGAAVVAIGPAGPGPRWIGLGVLYVALPCVILIWLRDTVGRNTCYWLFALVWATDVGAYAFGRLIGGPKLAQRISPKKTWAGLIGAAACAAAVGAFVSLLLRGGPFWPLAAISAGLALVAQAGDLFESWVKRQFGVKDAGNIMPGHGGLLDRVDGLLAAAVALAAAAVVDGNRVLVWL